jgi:hypothetical protein
MRKSVASFTTLMIVAALSGLMLAGGCSSSQESHSGNPAAAGDLPKDHPHADQPKDHPHAD